MEYKDKISIIVPVYKVEEFLDECVQSILHQTYRNFELVLVDDGSPDCCGKMCDAYQKKDSRIKVIHKENGGLSDARNAGLKSVNGEYITFIDSDDMVAEKYLECMYMASKMYGADIVQGEFTDNRDKIGTNTKKTTVVYTREEALEQLLKMKVVEVTAWGKLYRRECFTDVEYPKGRINEDNLTTYKNIWKSNKIVCIPDYIYFYRENMSSIMRSSFSARRFEILSFSEEIKKFLADDANRYKNLIEYSQMRIAVRLINECIIAGEDSKLENEIIKARNIVTEYNPDKDVCEIKYRCMVWLIKKKYTLFKRLVTKFKQ